MGKTQCYPKIYHLDSEEVAGILDQEIEITEKIDGSQIGFGILGDELIIRSKGAILNLDNPTGLFKGAVDYIKLIRGRLRPDVFYYGECLEKPRHNKLKYERIPDNHVILYGVKENGSFYEHKEVFQFAKELDLECVPLLGKGKFTVQELEEMCEKNSILGGEMEGIVVASTWVENNAKLVRPEFRERMIKSNKKIKQSKNISDNVEEFFSQFCTEARWDKAIQHLREDGVIEGKDKDIGLLIREIQQDVLQEEEDFIKENLWNIYKKKFLTCVVQGFPVYYQKRLLQEATKEMKED